MQRAFGCFDDLHERTESTRRCLALVSYGVLALMLTNQNAAAADIGFSCKGHNSVDKAQANLVCNEFAQFLRADYPRYTFIGSDTGNPRLDLLVLKAGPRTVSLDGVWVSPDGRKTAGKQLQTSFYDRNADTQSRSRFFAIFLKHNPIPF